MMDDLIAFFSAMAVGSVIGFIIGWNVDEFCDRLEEGRMNK